jgi:hypothetical protein
MVKSSDIGEEGNTASSVFKVLPGITKATKNSGEPWGGQEVRDLRALANQKMSTRLIGIKLGRTEASIRGKFLREGIRPAPPSGEAS